MSIYTHIALVASGLYLTACASTPEKLQGADYYYVEGQKAYDKKRCVEASEHFQRLVSNFPGSQRVTESQYMLAESYFCQLPQVKISCRANNLGRTLNILDFEIQYVKI